MLILIFFYCYQWFLLPKYEKGILSEAELSCKMIGSNMENSVIRTISQLDYNLYTETETYDGLYADTADLTLRQSLDLILFMRSKLKEYPSLHAMELYFEKSGQTVSTEYGLYTKQPAKKYAQKLSLSPYIPPVPFSEKYPTEFLSFSHSIVLTNQEGPLNCTVSYIYAKNQLADLLQISQEQMPVFLTDFTQSWFVFSTDPHLNNTPEDTRIAEFLQKPEIHLKDRSFLSCSYTGDSSIQVIRWVSVQDIAKGVYEMNRIFWLFFLFILGLAIVLALIGTYFLYNPWKQLMLQVCHQKLGQQKSTRNEYFQIIHAFQSMQTKLSQLEDSVAENRMIATNNFFLELLKGHFSDQQYLTHQFEICGLTFPYQYYQSVDIHFLPEQLSSLSVIEFQFLKANLINEIKAGSHETCRFYPVETDEYTITLIIHANDQEMKEELGKMFAAIPDAEYLFPRIVRCAVGSVQQDILKVSASKAEATEAFAWYYLYPERPFYTFSTDQMAPSPTPWDGERNGKAI